MTERDTSKIPYTDLKNLGDTKTRATVAAVIRRSGMSGKIKHLHVVQMDNAKFWSKHNGEKEMSHLQVAICGLIVTIMLSAYAISVSYMTYKHTENINNHTIRYLPRDPPGVRVKEEQVFRELREDTTK